MNPLISSFIETIQSSINIKPTQISEGVRQGFVSSIKLQNQEIFFCCELTFLKLLASEMLFEDQPSQEILLDLSKELANLVVGHAKVLYSKQNKHLNLGTPQFWGEDYTIQQNNGLHFELNGTKCSIYME
ncbi:hypothetical protein BBW65_02595 [Helicobacter enhydrae]|uniref:Chemotaxis phosphatase CheX-like domain-containing protein n=1 Tax=Helicobacter enhydrae TaxID=222136 RepID=A0A1B1U4P4_9HELI|nr:chemotaxis protein CheX [Helicobacter enhydrae]ANV97757.1 hypothetical protein BBW65_02595 [Helicobacter enhydrae]